MYKYTGSTPIPGMVPPERALMKKLMDSYSCTTKGTQVLFQLKSWETGRKVPDEDCEVFCGGLPFKLIDFQLLAFFAGFGEIYEIRVPVEHPHTKRNKGYAFVTFMTHAAACEASGKMEGYAICPGRVLKAEMKSDDRNALIVGNIPKPKSKQTVGDELCRRNFGVKEVIFPVSHRFNELGFCCMVFDSHYSASVARRKISNDRYPYWGRKLTVRYAERVELAGLRVSTPIEEVQQPQRNRPTFVYPSQTDLEDFGVSGLADPNMD